MSSETTTVNVLPVDGGLDAAAMAIAKVRSDEDAAPSSEPALEAEQTAESRGPDGKFKSRYAADQEATPPEDDDDYIEVDVPGEDGKEATRERYKLPDVLQGYHKAKQLEAQVAELQRAKPLPEDYETELAQMVQERIRYAQALQEFAQFNQPQQPIRELINPASPNYNPEAYYQQMQAFDEAVALQQQAQNEARRVHEETRAQQEVVARSRHQRERTKVLETWPEVKDEAYARQVYADLASHYGLDGKTVASVIDHRFFALAKDALAYRKAQAAQKEAVKAVTAKPKLVRATARTTTTGSATGFHDAMGRLTQSHSIEDGARAIAALSK